MRILFRTGEKNSSIHSISSMVMDRSQPNPHLCLGRHEADQRRNQALPPGCCASVLLDRHAGIPGKTSFTACISNRNVGRTWTLIRDAKPQNACVACKHHFKEPQVWHFKVVVVGFFQFNRRKRGIFLALATNLNPQSCLCADYG